MCCSSVKADTDEAYDRGATLLLESVAAGGRTSACWPRTTRTLSKRPSPKISELGLENDHGVHFAQIMGMCDLLTLALGKSGYNSHKLVLFGEFAELFPWLLRRLDENRDILGGRPERGAGVREEEIGRQIRKAKLVNVLLRNTSGP